MNIDANKINSYLNNSFYEVEVFDVIPSTNTYLKSIGYQEKEGKVVIANRQTSGKGRMNRKFISENGGIYLSILVKPKSDLVDSTLLTVISAISVVDGIKKATSKDTSIKWVNDVYYNNKKLAGILCEGVSSEGKVDYVVIGIGINIKAPINGFDEEIKNIATSLYNNTDSVDYNLIISNILKEFYNNYLNIDKSFLDKYKEYSCLLNKNVKTINLLTNEVDIVKVLDIDSSYKLVVLKDGKIEHLSNVEVRLELEND